MTPVPTFTRRSLLAMAAALAAPSVLRAAASRRVATLDWALLETLLALGADVVAGTELVGFRKIAVEPTVPESVADLGLRGTPNFEVLRFARPDLIFNSNFYGWADGPMSRIAPVKSQSIYRMGDSPFQRAQDVTLAIADELGLASGKRYADDLSARLDRYRTVLSVGDGRTILPINLGDARHYRVFGSDSMFGEVLARTGLKNAWEGKTSYTAMAPIGIETLASMPDAWIVFIPPHPPDALVALQNGAFWQALPAVREKRVLTIGSINPYGALPAASRFADLLAKGLTDAWNG